MPRACALMPSVVCPAVQYFPQLYHKWYDFLIKVIEHNISAFIFSRILSETFIILRRTKRVMIIYVISVFMQSTRYSCQILMELAFPRQIFEKYSHMKFHKKPSSGSWVVPCRQTDGQTWRRWDSLFSILRKRLIKIEHSAHTTYLCLICVSEQTIIS